MKKYLILIIASALLLLACNRNPIPGIDPEIYRSEIEAWSVNRLNNLKALKAG